MSMQGTLRSLTRLVELRARAVDATRAELARRHALAERMRQTLQRMHDLLREVGRHTAGSAVLASNSAHYKASLVDMIARQRRELSSHEALVEAARIDLEQVRLLHERLSRALETHHEALRRQAHARDQKRQDQLATQSWVHAHPAAPF